MVILLAGIVLATAPATDAQTTRPAAAPKERPPAKIVRQTHIAASADRVWAALTEKKLLADWFAYPLISGEAQVGEKMIFGMADRPMVECEVLELTKKRHLKVRLRFIEPAELSAEPPGIVTYRLREWGPSTQLRIEHTGLERSPLTAVGSPGVWDSNIARLKTLLETGIPLAFSWEQLREYTQREDLEEPADRMNPMACVNQITLYVDDLKDVRPWYEEVFQLPLAGFSLDWIKFSMATPRIMVKEVRHRATETAGRVRFDFRASGDIEPMYRRLSQAKVQMIQPLSSNRYRKEFAFVGPGGFEFHVLGPAVVSKKPTLKGQPTTRPTVPVQSKPAP